MGMLVPPPFDHPNFEKIMNKRIKWIKLQLFILIVGTLIGILVIGSLIIFR